MSECISNRELEDADRAVVLEYLEAHGPVSDKCLVTELSCNPGCEGTLRNCHLLNAVLDLFLEKQITITGTRDNYTIDLPPT
jgi:hypothetical protein